MADHEMYVGMAPVAMYIFVSHTYILLVVLPFATVNIAEYPIDV